MTSAAKLQKDKLHGSTPRFAPRATAASMARAARNANNRSPPLKSKASSSPPKSECSPGGGVPHDPQQPELIIEQKDNQPPQQENNESKEECKNDNKEANIDEMNYFGAESVDGQDTCVDDITIEEIKIIDDVEINRASVLDNDKTETESSHKYSVSSRPQTPKSAQLNPSRSPKAQSRPVTPVKPSSRPVTTSSRPNKPTQSSLPRPKTSPTKSGVRTQPQPNNDQLIVNQTSANSEPDDVSAQFTTKQKEFHQMKKELDLKQQDLLKIYNNLQVLWERMVKEGKYGEGEGFNNQELVMYNVADWTADEVSQLCHNNDPSAEGAGEIIRTIRPIGDETLSEWDTKVLNLPGNFADLCLQAFTARQEVIDWVKEIIANQEAINEEDLSRITIYNKQGLELCDMLRELKTLADECLHGMTQLLKQACHERGVLLTVGESLVKEVARLRQDIALHIDMTTELKALNAAESDVAKALEDTRRELEEERASKATIKDKLTTTETQLRQTKVRVGKMDRQLREAEASIASLTMTVKSLEDQSRQKEVQLEARARKLKESLKTGEMTNNQIAQQRDILQTELAQLKEQLERNAMESKTIVQDLNNQIKELRSALEVERNTKHEEMEMKIMLEDSYRESMNTIDELKMHIAELENNKQNSDLPTEQELELRAELLATKDTLRIAEEEMIACKREKVRFLETLAKITEAENKMGMQQKLAAELLSKEEIMSKMQIQIRELTKSIKLNEQKVLQYEQYVRDLRAFTPESLNCQESCSNATYQELQQEIMNLRMSLLETAHKNEELTEMLMQKDQQLEQQDKTSRAQARLIKVREELINMLKNKETEQSRELSTLQEDLDRRMKIVDEVNKQIAAKAEEIQELFSTLENKQQQIHRLEKIVLALEEQQRRAQAQRTRHEEKIAALEHELAAGGIKRERKFLFF